MINGASKKPFFHLHTLSYNAMYQEDHPWCKSYDGLTLQIWALVMPSSTSSGSPTTIPCQTCKQEYCDHTSTDKRNSNISELTIAGERVRIGAYIRIGKNLETEFLDAKRRIMQRWAFRREEKVIVSGMFLKDGTIMAFSIQKDMKRDL